MRNKKRVLIAGIGQSNFLKQLYSSIHQVAPGSYEFDIFGLNELSGKDEYGIEVFNKIYSVRKQLLPKDLKNLLDLNLLYLSIRFIRFGLSVSSVRTFIKNYIITKTQFKDYKLDDYDIVHIHFPTFQKLDIYWHISTKVKCIVSFWGSDLMRNKGVFNYYIQSHVTKRADKITTHGNELKQEILTKFGRNLEHKIVFTRFSPYDRFYTLIEEKINQSTANFETFFCKYKIPSSKRIIVVGHNGTPENNHIRILEALNNLPIEIKEGCFLILPFSYKSSADGAYEERCRQTLKKVGFEGMIMKDFLSWDELAIFKCITDIMIHMPASDALSGAMTEALFAGAKVITGDWLPYSPFLKEGLVFTSTDFNSLHQTFLKVYESLPEDEAVAARNREIIKEKFLSEYCAKTWLPVLN